MLGALPWQLVPTGAAHPALSQLPLQVPTAHGPPRPARDRFRTMINVLGDALAAGIMAHICRKDFAQDTVTKVRTMPPSQHGHPKAPGGWSLGGMGTNLPFTSWGAFSPSVTPCLGFSSGTGGD